MGRQSGDGPASPPVGRGDHGAVNPTAVASAAFLEIPGKCGAVRVLRGSPRMGLASARIGSASLRWAAAILWVATLTLVPSRASFAAGVDLFFAQTAQGSNDGTSCANAYAYGDAAHGIALSAVQQPGNILHLCGTFSLAAGAPLVSAVNSGTSASPITLRFETGAVVEAPYFTNGFGAVITLYKDYWILDGGSNGLLQSTLNGSAGGKCPGGPCQFQEQNDGVVTAGIGNEIKNLTCADLYDQTVQNDPVGNTGAGSCISIDSSGNHGGPNAASNISVHDNVIHDAGTGVYYLWGTNNSNIRVYNNDIARSGWSMGCSGSTDAMDGFYIYNNHFHDNANWTLGNGATHVNGIHCFDQTNGASGGIQSFYLYNNLFDGDMGTCCWTSWVYLEANGPGKNWNGATGTAYIFNNVFVADLVNGNGILNMGGGQNHVIVDNYFYGQAAAGPCIGWGGTGVTIENNVMQNCGQAMSASPFGGNPTPSWKTIDYNIYANLMNGNHLWQVNSFGEDTLASWQAACNCDAHSQAQLGSLLSDITSEGVPSAGFVGIHQGANLISLATGDLASLTADTGAGNTHAPIPRPASGAWDVGAYQFCMGSGCAQPDGGAGDAAAGKDSGGDGGGVASDSGSGLGAFDAGGEDAPAQGGDAAANGDNAGGSSGSGCGCKMAGPAGNAPWLALLGVVGAALLLRRRRQQVADGRRVTYAARCVGARPRGIGSRQPSWPAYRPSIEVPRARRAGRSWWGATCSSAKSPRAAWPPCTSGDSAVRSGSLAPSPSSAFTRGMPKIPTSWRCSSTRRDWQAASAIPTSSPPSTSSPGATRSSSSWTTSTVNRSRTSCG
jgi:MYXO-CTERM domain-containing protein